jgi:glucan endo-1,3-alpha-glucosidase
MFNSEKLIINHSVRSFDAAGALGPTFKLFFSFDMAASSCATLDDAKLLRDKITAFSPSANMLRVNGKVFASTFAGESWCLSNL